MTLLARGPATQAQSQWQNPSDILSLLLIVGPDVVQKALAQLTGSLIAPVAFSFGWVAYSYATLVSVFGNGRLMPDTDSPCLVVDAHGHKRTNTGWVVGRLLRDFENRADAEGPWRGVRPAKVPGGQLAEVEAEARSDIADALCVTVFEADLSEKVGVPKWDLANYLGLLVIMVQCAVAAVPWGLSSNYLPFVITLGGTVLSLLTGAMPQWGTEKFASYKMDAWTAALTRGNGSRHVMLVLGQDHHKAAGLDLEVMSTGNETWRPTIATRISAVILTILWTVLLITVSGVKGDTWYLLAVGALGMIQNIYAAGAVRSTSSVGVHLKEVTAIGASKVATVLQRTEEQFPGMGLSLVPVYFPGGMRVGEKDLLFWNEAKQKTGLDNVLIYQI